jgi:hypothetical protein
VVKDILGDISVFSCTTDNGANVCKAARDLDCEHNCCAAHTLQLVIRQSLAHEDVQRLVTHARRVVAYFRQSTVASSRLASACETAGHAKKKLYADVQTRWDSTLLMLRRLWELRAPVAAALADLGAKAPAPLAPDQLDLTKSLTEVLEPFAMSTEALSSEQKPTLSLLLPLITKLRRLEAAPGTAPGVTQFVDLAGEELDRRWFHRREVMDLLRKCSLVDPRFRRSDTEASRAMLRRLCEEAGVEVRAKPAGAVENTGVLARLFGGEDGPSTLEEELDMYFAEASISPVSDPLDWWRGKQDLYPTVAKVARRWLSIPATSASVERLFSRAGAVIDDRRTRLRPATAEMLVGLQLLL